MLFNSCGGFLKVSTTEILSDCFCCSKSLRAGDKLSDGSFLLICVMPFNEKSSKKQRHRSLIGDIREKQFTYICSIKRIETLLRIYTIEKAL